MAFRAGGEGCIHGCNKRTRKYFHDYLPAESGWCSFSYGSMRRCLCLPGGRSEKTGGRSRLSQTNLPRMNFGEPYFIGAQEMSQEQISILGRLSTFSSGRRGGIRRAAADTVPSSSGLRGVQRCHPCNGTGRVRWRQEWQRERLRRRWSWHDKWSCRR